MDTETGEMIVKRVSVPIGLEELMEGLVKEVLLKKPDDIYQFAARYFAHLLTVRDKVPVSKVKTLRSVQTIKSKPEKPPIHAKTSKLSKQFSIREDSTPLDSPIISQKPKMYQRNELKYNKRRHTGPSTVLPNNQQLTIRRKYAKSVSGEIEKPATAFNNNNKSKSHTRRERSNESVDRSNKTMNERNNYSKLPILAENNIAKVIENNNNNDTDETKNKKEESDISNESKESLQKDEDGGKNIDEEEQKCNSIKLEDGVNVSQKSENTSAEKKETYILTPSRTIDDEEVSRVLLSSISNTENSTVDISELQNASPKSPSAIDESKLNESKLLNEKDHKMDETSIDTNQIDDEKELKEDLTIKMGKNDDQLKAEVKTLEEDQVSDKKGSKMDITKAEIKEKDAVEEKEEIKTDHPVTTGKNDGETKIVEGELSEDSLELDEEKEKEEKPTVSPELPDITHNLLITEDPTKDNKAGKSVDNKPEELIKESENFKEEKLEDGTEDEETKKLKLEVNENITNDLPISRIDHSLKSCEESVDTNEKLGLEDNLLVSSKPCDEKTDLKGDSVKEKNIEIESVPDIDKETAEDPKTDKNLKKEELSEETNKIENTDDDINNSNKIQNNSASEEENVKDDNINLEKDPESTTKLQVSEKDNNNEENDIKISNKHDNADKEIRNINEVNEKSTKKKLEKMITFDVEDNNKNENVIKKFEKMATTDEFFVNNKRNSDEMTAKNNLEKMETFDVADINDKDSSLPLEIPADNTENLEKIILKENSTVSQENNEESEKIKQDKKIEEMPKLLNATLPTVKAAAGVEANITENLDEGDANDKIKDEISDQGHDGNKFETTIENITKIGDNDELMNKEQSEKDVLKKENDKIEETTDENIKMTKLVATISNNEETETNNNKNENIDSENIDNKEEKIDDTESKEQLKETFNNVDEIEDATVNNGGENKESFDDVKICSDKETKSRVNMENENTNQSFETGNNKTDNASEIKEAIGAENINKKEDNKKINSLEIVGNTEQTVNASDSVEVLASNTENVINNEPAETGKNKDKVIETKELGDNIKKTEKSSDHVDSLSNEEITKINDTEKTRENKTDNIEDNNQINTNENRTKRSVSFEEAPKNIIDNNNATDADDKDEDTYNIKSKSDSDNNLVDRVAKNYVNYVIDNDRYLVNDSDNSAIDEIDLDTADNETETKSDELINENSDNSTIESPSKNKQSIESDDATAVVKNEEEIVEDTAMNKKDEDVDKRVVKGETNDVSSNNLKSEDEDFERTENETEHSTETTSNEVINSENSSADNSKHRIERDNVAVVKVEDKKDKEEDRKDAKDETNDVSSKKSKLEDKDIERKENEAEHSIETTSNEIINSDNSNRESADNSKHSIERDNVAGVKVEDQMVEDTAIGKKDKEEDRNDAKDETNHVSSNKAKLEDEDIERKKNETEHNEIINSNDSTRESADNSKHSIERDNVAGVKVEDQMVEDTALDTKDKEEDRNDAKDETSDVSSNKSKLEDEDIERKENETEHSRETTSNEIIKSSGNSKHSIDGDDAAVVKVEEQMVEDTAVDKKDKEEDRNDAKDEVNDVSRNKSKTEDGDIEKKENEAEHSIETTSNEIIKGPGNSKHSIDGDDAAVVKVEEQMVEDTVIDKKIKEEDRKDAKDGTNDVSSNKSKLEDEDIERKENETRHSTETTSNEIMESPGNSKHSIDGDNAAVVKVEDTAIDKKDKEEDRKDAKDETNDVSSNKSKAEEEDIERKENETEHSTETKSNQMINSVKSEDQMVEDAAINKKDKEEDRIHAKKETNEDAKTSSNNTKSVDEDIERNESVKTAAQNLIQSTLSIAETSLIEHKVKTFLNDFIDKEKNNVPSAVKQENKNEVFEETIKKDTAPLQNIKPLNKTMSSDSINTRPVNGIKKTVSFDSSKLRHELKKIEEESKFTSFKSSYNPFLLRKEIEDVTEKKPNDGLVLTSMNFTKVVNATLRIQRYWRRYRNRKSIEAKMENKEPTVLMEEDRDSGHKREVSNQLGDLVASANAAVIIQRMWRGFKSRKASNMAKKKQESEENCTSCSMAKENPDTTEEENATEERRLFSAESTGSVNTVIFNDPKDDSKTNHSFHNEYYSGEVGNILDEILDYPTVEEEYLLDNYQSKLLDKISGKEEDNKFDDIKAYEKIVSPKRIDDINLEPLKDEVYVPLVPKPVDKNDRKLTRSLSSKLEILEEESATPEEEEEHMKDSDVQTEDKLYTFCSEPTPIPCEKKLIDVLSQNVTEETGNRKQETLVIPLPTEVKNKLKHNEKQEICDLTNLDDISSILSNAGIDCGEIHDTVVVPINERHAETGRSHPISVQLYQTSDAENLMTSSTDVTGSTAARDAENAQDPGKADLRVDSQFVLSGSPPHSMESEKRRKIDGAIMEAQAATKIQAGFRGYQVRKQLKLKNGSSDMTNSKKSTRSKSTGSLDSCNNQSQKPEKIEEQSAVKIQAGIRGFLVRRRQKKVSTKQA